MRIVIANSNAIHRTIEKQCEQKWQAVSIHSKDELSLALLKKIEPEFIFFPHWSHIIPEEIFNNFTCIVFHMTDLPYGRGGSPLQNLIVRGHADTMISAIKVERGLDTGPVFLKKPLSLAGSAEEIFLRSGKIIFNMIEEIIEKKLQPQQQTGDPVIFRRRTPTESNIQALSEIDQVYDHIRMLDSEGYPKAFLETEFFRIEFSRASLKADGVVADVKIIKKL